MIWNHSVGYRRGCPLSNLKRDNLFLSTQSKEVQSDPLTYQPTDPPKWPAKTQSDLTSMISIAPFPWSEPVSTKVNEKPIIPQVSATAQNNSVYFVCRTTTLHCREKPSQKNEKQQFRVTLWTKNKNWLNQLIITVHWVWEIAKLWVCNSLLCWLGHFMQGEKVQAWYGWG